MRMHINVKKILFLILAALLLGTIGFLIKNQFELRREGLKDDEISEPIDSSTDNLQVLLPYDELASVSKIIAIGKVTSQTEKRFADIPGITSEDLDKEGVRNGTYLESTFEFSEVLYAADVNFSLSSIAIVRTLTFDSGSNVTSSSINGDSDLSLNSADLFLLFLDEGRVIYKDKYFPQGTQGIGVLKGDTINFRDGRSITLSELRTILEKLPN